ncbi:MAG: hypothetical protein J0I43_09665 [Microbacterium sp.]|uniref:hypothetical protein n=1 Tax=Microbacterium sp. TaxID=51671 RepID=UPI001ACC3F54|nr:hypothetical protein [Microbacterium sp.]MBN9177618.1 hypothetical protein [Microbacterium sp.]
MTASDSMRDPAEAAAGFLRALEKLPAFSGVVFHGLAEVPEISRARMTNGVIATSVDPRVATENFSAPVIAAFLSKTGRDIAAFSAHPGEREVVLPPQILVRTLSVSTAPDGVTPLVVIEQLAESPREPWIPSTIDGLVELVRDRIAAAMAEPAVEVTTPGKFTDALFFL